METERQEVVYQHFVSLFNGAPIKETMGMSLHYDKGQAIFEWPHDPHYNHSLHDVHGGIIATLLDHAGWFTVGAHYGCWVVTSEFHVRLIEAAKQEDLLAVGRIIQEDDHEAVTEMEVRTKSGRLIATGSGKFAKTPRRVIQ